MTGIDYKERKPVAALSDFVESFWMLTNTGSQEKAIVLVPDGRIDLSFSFEPPYALTLLGLESGAASAVIPAGMQLFSVSFNLLAIEYFFERKFPLLVDTAYQLPAGYLGITAEGYTDFDRFCDRLSELLIQKIPTDVDARKKKLFDMIYTSRGAVSISGISETLHWSSRQINRYFNDRFGLSLKEYCNILRFRASFQQIKEGRLFPEEHFSDQAHFIKNVKKFSGVTPKELSKNKNDRFIQFSTLEKK